MDGLAGRTSSASRSLTVNWVQAELPAIKPVGRGEELPLSFGPEAVLAAGAGRKPWPEVPHPRAASRRAGPAGAGPRAGSLRGTPRCAPHDAPAG